MLSHTRAALKAAAATAAVAYSDTRSSDDELYGTQSRGRGRDDSAMIHRKSRGDSDREDGDNAGEDAESDGSRWDTDDSGSVDNDEDDEDDDDDTEENEIEHRYIGGGHDQRWRSQGSITIPTAMQANHNGTTATRQTTAVTGVRPRGGWTTEKVTLTSEYCRHSNIIALLSGDSTNF